jgi:hypothetical protein
MVTGGEEAVHPVLVVKYVVTAGGEACAGGDGAVNPVLVVRYAVTAGGEARCCYC